MLETIREFALEFLARDEQADALRDRHRDWFLDSRGAPRLGLRARSRIRGSAHSPRTTPTCGRRSNAV